MHHMHNNASYAHPFSEHYVHDVDLAKLPCYPALNMQSFNRISFQTNFYNTLFLEPRVSKAFTFYIYSLYFIVVLCFLHKV